MASSGKVYLVGAGPGDPGLLTRKGERALAAAEVVVYDRLLDPSLLELAPDAETVFVGKERGRQALRQSEINDLLVAEGQAGKTVVRLKGGDPFVFGRGGEEAQALASAGVPFEVVPGVTSAVAAAAYAGIPVTHRGVSTSVTIVTGSEDPCERPDQHRLGRLGQNRWNSGRVDGLGHPPGHRANPVRKRDVSRNPSRLGPMGHLEPPAHHHR